MIFSYDEEFMNIKIYDDIPDIREEKPKEIIEIPDIMDAWEFYKSVVRCKECKNAHMTYGGDCKYCDMWKDDDDFCIELYLDGDFYCAYGERKESER